MRKSLFLLPILVCSCAHRIKAPRRPPTDAGNGQLVYTTWGHSPEKVEKKLNGWSERYCASLGATITVDKTEAVVPGHLNEMRLVFHCNPIAAGAAAPNVKDDADAAQEDLDKEEETK